MSWTPPAWPARSRIYEGSTRSMVQEKVKRKGELADGVEKADLSLQESQQQLDQIKASQKLEMDTKTRQQQFDTDELALHERKHYTRLQRQVKESLVPAAEPGRQGGGDQVQRVRAGEERQRFPIGAREAEIGPSGQRTGGAAGEVRARPGQGGPTG